ncbi:hypothetical protein RKE30_05880 [Streptomyces sp. Li-HN-5-11]|uniref:hypothetical protein n=1 Tax=Streptomyces sp. Li-HN-5-11 TaxID=3075432 RepID=UPI0028AB518F|nr:hypothetical protein [Streptomyces sp. Li-HN-5-11]WNM29961.1 hypothetical protein RKE30_05880 [Streptomyces sp. Li-HN-5-11]
MKHTAQPSQGTRTTGTFKRRGIKTAVIGAIAAGGLMLSTSDAFAAGIGGDVYTANCHAYINSAGAHWGYGAVAGASGCEVDLWQTNVNTGGWTQTGWYYGSTPSEYHADGVHYLQVEVYDPYTGSYAWGPLIY